MVTAASPLVRASSLTGRPVVTSAGSSCGEIQDLVLDDDGRTITAFTLRDPGVFGRRHTATVSVTSVSTIGPDAVLIGSAEDLGHDENEPAVCTGVIGSQVITEAGVEVGKITDVVIETRRNHVRVEAVELGTDGTTQYLVLDDSVRLAGDVVVVASGSEKRLHETPESVAERLDNHRG